MTTNSDTGLADVSEFLRDIATTLDRFTPADLDRHRPDSVNAELRDCAEYLVCAANELFSRTY